MKIKILTLFSLAFLACGGPKAAKSTFDTSEPLASTERKEAPQKPQPCGQMPFFQAGSEIISKSFDESGKETASQTIQVLEVRQDGGISTAQVQGTLRSLPSGKETLVNFSYTCDGKSVYFDIASMYRTEAKASDPNFEAGEYAFPLQVQVGEQLPDIRSSMETEQGGNKMSMTITISNRKVESRENITTEAGTWDTFKITHDLKIDMELPGMDAKMKEMIAQMQAQTKMTAITWFAPDLGIVQSETYKNGVLESSNRIVSINLGNNK